MLLFTCKLFIFTCELCVIRSRIISLAEAFYSHAEGPFYPHPGIVNDEGRQGDKKYYAYYQWVPVVLFLQAVFCFAPKYLWNSYEGGRLKAMTSGLMVKMLSEEEKQKEKKILVKYLLNHVNVS